MFSVKRKGGFTLVELLVVISIIALLLAVLMPALSKVREQGKAVVCSSRLRQLGLACELYRQAYNNNFFPSYTGSQAWASSAQGAELQRLAGTKIGFYPGSIFDCTSQKPRGAELPDWKWPAFLKYLDYAYNGSLGDGDITSTTLDRPKAKIRQPSRIVMFWDSTRYRGYHWPTIYDYWNNKHARNIYCLTDTFMFWPHSKSANFLFVDTHIEKAVEKNVMDTWFDPGF
jgi:prepilin-type N-terminal cleavage/methylation domain-containing protein/prepilin-type processing-associated H-X9-DG protein